jgi:hypothetical protein
MARIKTYTVDTTVSDKDIVIGTDGDNNGKTKNFQVSDLRQYLLSGLDPETGGNLKITTISATDEVNLTPEDYFNNSEEPIVVLHYEIVFLILNGRTFIFRKNNDIYGVGETQVISSDFTEIDITSVITSSLEAQDLDTVLSQGNESLRDAKINRIYLWDTYNNTDYGSYMTGYKNRVNFYQNNNNLYLGYFGDKLMMIKSGQYEYKLSFPIISSDKIAYFQNLSGTVAYLSDIDDAIEGISVGVLDIESSDETVLVTSNDGVYDLSVGYRTYVTNTQLRDSLTNTVFYQQGGVFDYDSVTIPINSVRFQFNRSIGSLLESGNYGIVYFLYEDGSVNYYLLQFSDVVVSGNTLTAVFPLEDYWSDVVGQRLSVIDLTLYPDCVKAVGGNYFEGGISGTISKYIYKWK